MDKVRRQQHGNYRRRARMVLTAVFFSLLLQSFAGLRSGLGVRRSVSLLHATCRFATITTSPPLNSSRPFCLASSERTSSSPHRRHDRAKSHRAAPVLWLLRLYRPAYAAVAAFATLIISTADFTDTIASYNHALSSTPAERLLRQFCAGPQPIRPFSRLDGLARLRPPNSSPHQATVGLGAP